MAAVAFDTLKLARKLQDIAQMPQIQAEGVAGALAEAMSGAELATKGDVNAAKTELKQDIRELELKLDARFKEIDGRFKEIDSRFKEIDGRFKEIDGRFKEIDGRFGEVDSGFRLVLERIDRRAAESDAKAEAYKNTLLRWLLAFAGTTFVTVIGAAVAIIRAVPSLLHG